MKIISKFKDYYDGVASYGIDKSKIFIRNTELIDHDFSKDFRYKYNSKFDIIGFCGKLYPFISYIPFNQDCFNDMLSNRDIKKRVLYNDIIKYDLIEEKKEDYLYNTNYFYKKKKREKKNINKLINFINDYTNNKELLDLFIKYKTPIFWYGFSSRNGNILINPPLKKLGFQTMIDPVTAFQQIEMFLGNELATEYQGNVPVGNDEVVGNSKGFDRYSFRNKNTSKIPKKF